MGPPHADARACECRRIQSPEAHLQAARGPAVRDRGPLVLRAGHSCLAGLSRDCDQAGTLVIRRRGGLVQVVEQSIVGKVDARVDAQLRPRQFRRRRWKCTGSGPPIRWLVDPSSYCTVAAPAIAAPRSRRKFENARDPRPSDRNRHSPRTRPADEMSESVDDRSSARERCQTGRRIAASTCRRGAKYGWPERRRW